jgi:hypothetical protein
MDDREIQNLLNNLAYQVGELQKEIKRLDSRVDSASDFAYKSKLELAKKLSESDAKVDKMSKDVAALMKKK